MIQFARLVGMQSIQGSSAIELQALVRHMTRKGGSGAITQVKIEALKRALNASGSVYGFCKENPQFSKVLIYHILQGRRKRINPKVRELFTFLNIK